MFRYRNGTKVPDFDLTKVGGGCALFHVPPGTFFADSTRDGQRFLMAVPETEAGPGGTLTLVQNWTAALKK